MITAEVKKEFQKVVATIRKELNAEAGKAYEYPKAMMTGQQMRKNTATVNCGHSFTRPAKVFEHPAFKAFLQKHNAAASTELVGPKDYTQYQLRLCFLGVQQ